jgi:nicotinamidase-related amidase
MKKRALVVIDVQNEYFPGGKLELEGVRAAGEAVGRALAAARKAGIRVFHVRHENPDPQAARFAARTIGSEIAAYAAPLAEESVTTKYMVDSFAGTELEAALVDSGAEELVVAGMMTHMCVDAFLRAANARGYPCILLGDACATRELEWGGRRVAAADVSTAFFAAFTFAGVRIMDTGTWTASLV